MKKLKLRDLVAVVILVLLFIIMVCLARWSYMWMGEYLSKWASVIAIISFGFAPAWYFWTKHQNDQDERSRASKNLYIELNDALDGLNPAKHPDLKKVKINESEFYFMNRALNHDFYDSLVYSGKIAFLRPELLQPLQDTFQRIKDHNFYIRKIRDIEDYSSLGEDITGKTYRYYEKLYVDEEKLFNEIPLMQEKLREEFKIDNAISSSTV